MTKQPVTYQDILALIRAETGVTMGQLRGTKGEGRIPKIRHLLNYMARKHTKLNCNQIAWFLVRHRTTIIFSVHSTKLLLEKSTWFKELHDKIDKAIVEGYVSAGNAIEAAPEPVKQVRGEGVYSNRQFV